MKKNIPIRMEGTVQDITKRKEIEEALINVQKSRKKEIHHRIKNNLQVISSLLDLQAEKFRGRKNIKDYEILEAFRESQDRVRSMALIHEELYDVEEATQWISHHTLRNLLRTFFRYIYSEIPMSTSIWIWKRTFSLIWILLSH